MHADDKLPALRNIEILPFRRPDGEIYFALQDPAELKAQPLAVSAAAYLLLAHLDGEHTLADVQAAFRRHTNMEVPVEEIQKLLAALDDALLLANERAAQADAARQAAYRAAPARDNRERYPDAANLRAELERILASGAAAPVAGVRGLIAPHLDYARGGPCYADAYATLAASGSADRYVILGTNYFGRATSVVATGKDFLTPLGLVPTDRNFLAGLESRLNHSLANEETDHLREHSIELQVHFLQVIADGRPFEIVPALCPDICGPTGTRPQSGNGVELRDFAAALGAVSAESEGRTVIIAGADLSHVGQRFQDPDPTTPQRLAEVARSDQRLLKLLEERNEDAFVSRLIATSNATRVCSAGCILALLVALPGRPCRILKYHQASNAPAETHVTCAAAVVA
jgi:AmmeMemoRadiSam system protein B